MPISSKNALSFLALLLSACFLSACAMQRAQDAAEAQQRLRGASQDKIFACMGIPDKKATRGAMEIWAYKSGNLHTERSGGSARMSMRSSSDDSFFDSLTTGLGASESVSETRSCKVQILFQDGIVTAIHYTGPTGGFLTEDEQCAFAIRNCL